MTREQLIIELKCFIAHLGDSRPEQITKMAILNVISNLIADDPEIDTLFGAMHKDFSETAIKIIDSRQNSLAAMTKHLSN